MGYTTEFEGQFAVSPKLTQEHSEYLSTFSGTRRMKRNPSVAKTLPDPKRIAAGLQIGKEGAYFVGGGGFAGQEKDESIIDYSSSPSGQPSLWCQWVPTEDGSAIEWDGGEKFYDYTEWISYLIEHFLAPWGYTLNGQVLWQGEDLSDRGIIAIANNQVTTIDKSGEGEELDWMTTLQEKSKFLPKEERQKFLATLEKLKNMELELYDED